MNTEKITNLEEILKQAERGISRYLLDARETGRIDAQLYEAALKQTFPALKEWLECPAIPGVSMAFKQGIVRAVNQGKWEDLVNAYRQEVRFGTGGIRGMMAFDKASILRLADPNGQGIASDILKGPNTLNDLVLMKTTSGVATYGRAQTPPLDKVVVGYDSRIRGFDFAQAVAQVFLACGYTIYFFDAPCPYPEVTFAIPDETVKADIGVLISASHNDYRYNGYKLSCSNGSQFDPEERDVMYNRYIRNARFEDIRVMSFAEAPAGKLWFLGGDQPMPGFDYAGHEQNLINMHARHREHIKQFLLTKDQAERQKAARDPLHIAFCAFHGAGKIAVPRLLRETGFLNPRSINGTRSGLGLDELNGLFPAFCSEPGCEQQPDPGDPRSAETEVAAFEEDYPGEFEKVDIIIGTDPDADRCGITVKVPSDQKRVYNNKDYYLLPADDVWTLLLWFRLHREKETQGRILDTERKFVTLSHTTTDAVTRLARKHDIGVVRTWVGFAALTAATRDVWDGKARQLLKLVDGHDEKYPDLCHPFVIDCQGMESGIRSVNIAAMEQSNGFSILGGPPPDRRSLGQGGHVRDKDGTFAALLVAEVAAWAKEQKSSLIELLDKYVYLDPDVGLFATFYEPDPLDGEYPGIEGDRLKKNILLKALRFHADAARGRFELAGNKVLSSAIYRTGKYDAIYPPSEDFQFADEGIRFFFDAEKLQHLTVRPSGTGNSLRFHIQLHARPSAAALIEAKMRLRAQGRAIMDDLRRQLGAPRQPAVR